MRARRAAMPGPICQKSVSGSCVHNFSRKDCSSSSATRTPSLSAGSFLAVMSMAIFAKYRFVPMPPVAVIPWVASTSRIMVVTSSWAVLL